MPAFAASPYLSPILLLIGSNIFMTIAWYWHLRFKEVPLFTVILISWGLAFIEYCLAVPANRYGNAVYTAVTSGVCGTMRYFAGATRRMRPALLSVSR